VTIILSIVALLALIVACWLGNKLLDGIEGIFRFCKRLDHMLSGKK
jgi:hypothetical protein